MVKMRKKKLIHSAFLIVSGIIFYVFYGVTPEFVNVLSGSAQPEKIIDSTRISSSNEQINQAFKHKISDIQVQGRGRVSVLLPDDTKGSRHQKMILELDSGQTLLIAHNIDLAPRINSLRKGDILEFYGEYEWNTRGGVLHWTHDDPAGRHEDGWLKHKGKVYQ